MARLDALIAVSRSIQSDHLVGSTPPAAFVGRMGYPKLYAGPMIPPYDGDTSLLDAPEFWYGKTIEQIITMRYSLVRGKARVHVGDAHKGSGLINSLQELALAAEPVRCEAFFTRMPSKTILLYEDAQPYGPSAPLRSFKTGNGRTNHRLERAYYDHDLRAADAMMELYTCGETVTRIQRCLSLGMFGSLKARRLVPTRWSITAVDSTISQRLISELKAFETIDDFRVYHSEHLDNRYVAILTPEPWKFEWVEAWFPGTAWNPDGQGPAIMGDWETFEGRTTYAQVGGCYYSARLAAAEALARERKQAGAIALREIHPGYILPVGVWNVRESIRALFRSEPSKFTSLSAAVAAAASRLSIPLSEWTRSVKSLREAYLQKRLFDLPSACAHFPQHAVRPAGLALSFASPSSA